MKPLDKAINTMQNTNGAVVLALEYMYNGNNIRNYMNFATFAGAIDYCKNNKHAHEIFLERENLLFFDFDKKMNSEAEVADLMRQLEIELPLAIASVINAPEPKMTIFEACGACDGDPTKWKFSAHVYFDVKTRNMAEMMFIATKVQEALPECFKGTVDLGVYHARKSMRVGNQSKLGSVRVLRGNGGVPIFAANVPAGAVYALDDPVEDDAEYVPKIQSKICAADIEQARALADPCAEAKMCRFHGCSENKLLYKRFGRAYCEFCEREHEDNLMQLVYFINIKNGVVYVREFCFHNEKKKHAINIGNFPSNDGELRKEMPDGKLRLSPEKSAFCDMLIKNGAPRDFPLIVEEFKALARKAERMNKPIKALARAKIAAMKKQFKLFGIEVDAEGLAVLGQKFADENGPKVVVAEKLDEHEFDAKFDFNDFIDKYTPHFETEAFPNYTKIADIPQFFALRGRLGVGKTKFLRDIINLPEMAGMRIVVPSFRQTFGADFNNKFPGFELYSDIRKPFIELNVHRRVVCQMESLRRLMFNDIDVLVLDEIVALCKQIFSPTFIKNHGVLNYNTFFNMIKCAKRIIVLDDGLSDELLEVISIIGGKKFVKHDISAMPKNAAGEAVTCAIDLCEKRESMIAEMLECCNAGVRFAVMSLASEEKINAMAKIIETRKFGENGANTRVLTITSRMDETVKTELFRHFEEAVAEFDVVIYSPTLTAGVSVEKSEFPRVFADLNACSADPDTVKQMAGRFRNKSRVTVLMHNNPNSLETRKWVIERYMESETAKLEYGEFSLLNRDADNAYKKLWIWQKAKKNREMNNFRMCVLSSLLRQGYTLDLSKLIVHEPNVEINAGIIAANAEAKTAEIIVFKQIPRNVIDFAKDADLTSETCRPLRYWKKLLEIYGLDYWEEINKMEDSARAECLKILYEKRYAYKLRSDINGAIANGVEAKKAAEEFTKYVPATAYEMITDEYMAKRYDAVRLLHACGGQLGQTTKIDRAAYDNLLKTLNGLPWLNGAMARCGIFAKDLKPLTFMKTINKILAAIDCKIVRTPGVKAGTSYDVVDEAKSTIFTGLLKYP